MAEGGLPKNDDYEYYLKDCFLYIITKSKKTTSITIKFNEAKTYFKFREIIIKHYHDYGEKKFENRGKNGYQCKSDEEKVNLTLHDGTFKLHVQGKGHEQWFKEKFGRLAEQLHIEMKQPRYQLATPKENLAELTTSKTHAVTGSEPLVSVKEFKSNFAIPNKYGDSTKDRPHTTILLYKYSSHATTRYQDYPENTWQRIDNDPKYRDYIGEHAESIMIKKLTKIQEHLKEQTDYKRGSYKGIHAIDVILSYSPCNSPPHCCSTKLREFKTRLEEDIRSAVEVSKDTTAETADDDSHSALTEKFTNLNIEGKVKEEVKIEMNIHFSNFYRVDELKNEKGLKSLCQKDIKLDVLTGNKWIYFYKAIGFELPEGREEREKDDEAKLLNIMQTI